jgi:hypothetical protein
MKRNPDGFWEARDSLDTPLERARMTVAAFEWLSWQSVLLHPQTRPNSHQLGMGLGWLVEELD